MSLPMAADCLRHFWLALARPKLFQSVFSPSVVTLLLWRTPTAAAIQPNF
jgi:hypothetical protein